jgi:hypothetical protein
MRKALSTLVLLVGAIVLMGQAELPKRKAGLWELTMSIEGTKAPMPSAKLCIDAATDAEFYKMGAGMSRDACSKRDLKVNGKTITVDSVCSFAANRTSTTHATTTFTGDTAYHTEVQMHYEPPLMGKSDSAMAQDGKWIGACPADMQPGDMLMPGGLKLNVRDLKAP